MARQGWSLSSYCGNNIFFPLVISAKIISKKVLILFDWTFWLHMWNERPPLYQVMKAIFPLFVPDDIEGLWLTTTMDKEQWQQTTPMKDDEPPVGHKGYVVIWEDRPPARWTTIRMYQDSDWWLMTMHHHQDGPRQWKTTDDDQPWQQWTTTMNDQQWHYLLIVVLVYVCIFLSPCLECLFNSHWYLTPWIL